jgi:rSAM/selenodomain-associated transferase 2
MRNALFDAIDRGAEMAVLVGTDIPHMTTDHLEDAFYTLNRYDLVLGPSHDGGYWLVGLRRKADIFQGIQWGGANVLNQALASARMHGLSVNCIQTLNDMDTEADLKGGLPSKEWQRPYLSVIIPTLNEEKHIAAVIQSVRSAKCEIIVTDGGSVDRTRAIARDQGGMVITGVRGRAEQQNAGAAVADGKVLLFLHADTLLPDDYGDQVFDTLMAHRTVAGAFQFRTDYDHWGMRLIEKIVHLRSTLLQMPYGDQALFLPKNTFENAGGFPSVPIAEDLYLVRRLSKLGRIALAPGAAVVSGRRWRDIGIWRATLINYLIALGCLVGVDPKRLAHLYRLWVKSSDCKRERP